MGNPAIGTMVVCLSCRKVVWAQDSDFGDVRGFANCAKLPCPLCGIEGNFDGWRVYPEQLENLDVPDGWAAMHKIADIWHFAWAADGESRWTI